MGELTEVSESYAAGQLGPFVTASVLLTDQSDNVLLVRSADGDSWTLPSSVVAGDEAPHDCVERFASQQLSLTAVAGRLLVISWTPAMDDHGRAVVNFLFDGGAVHNEAALPAGAGELGTIRFLSWDQAKSEVSATLACWLHAARSAREDGEVAYLPGTAEL